MPFCEMDSPNSREFSEQTTQNSRSLVGKRNLENPCSKENSQVDSPVSRHFYEKAAMCVFSKSPAQRRIQKGLWPPGMGEVKGLQTEKYANSGNFLRAAQGAIVGQLDGPICSKG